MPTIKFGEWLPDLPPLGNPGLVRATNVVPAGDSYTPFPTATVYSSNALDERCQGGGIAKDSAGNPSNFFGTASKLYTITGGALDDISKSGGYSTASDANWEFAKVGELVIATNFVDPIQSYELGVSTTFDDLDASAPKAAHIDTIPGFVIGGQISDSDGITPHRVRWSALNDATDWTPSATTQAGFNNLDSKRGWIQRVVGGRTATIFQEYAITVMEYVGTPDIFRFDIAEPGAEKGCLVPNSVIQFGRNIFYVGTNGFYAFNGQQSEAIGENKVNKTFFADFDLTYLSRVSTAIDIEQQVIYLLYVGQDSTGGRPSKIISWNYSQSATKRFAESEVDFEYLLTTISEGYNLDTLDSLGNLDELEFSLDSRVYTGNARNLTIVNSDRKIAYLNGAAMTALLQTGDLEFNQGGKTEIKRLCPIVDGGTSTIEIGTRNTLSGTNSFGSAISTNSEGNCIARSNARYHTFRLNVTGEFDHIQGIDVLDLVGTSKR